MCKGGCRAISAAGGLSQPTSLHMLVSAQNNPSAPVGHLPLHRGGFFARYRWAVPTPNSCTGGLYSPPMNIRSVSIQRPPCVKGAAAQSARLGDCLSQQACTCLFLRKTTPPPLWGTSPYTGEAFSHGFVTCTSLRGREAAAAIRVPLTCRFPEGFI